MLTVKQVHQIIDACKTSRMQTFFWTIYSLGLRLEKGLSLRVGGIDSRRMMVHVHRGKGAKDRYLPLPSSTLAMLRENWKSHRHPKLLFPNNRRPQDNVSSAQTPMGLTTVQSAIKQIAGKLNFGKKVSTHTLRHCYATHLLEAGLSLRAIQKLLGQKQLAVSGNEFVRGFLQHVLPRGLQKLRYYGFMSPNNKLQLENVRWLSWLYLG